MIEVRDKTVLDGLFLDREDVRKFTFDLNKVSKFSE